MEMEYGQFSAHLVAELRRFCDGKNAGDVRCLATFTVLVVAGGGIVGPGLGHSVVLVIAFITQTEGPDVFNGIRFNSRSIFCSAGSVYCLVL